MGRTGWLVLCAARVSDDKLTAVALLSAFAAFVAFAMSAPILYTRYGWISAALFIALRGVQLRAPDPSPSPVPRRQAAIIRSA
jgi:hypothetical protein